MVCVLSVDVLKFYIKNDVVGDVVGDRYWVSKTDIKVFFILK